MLQKRIPTASILILCFQYNAFCQFKISGKVTDINHTPLSHASVYIQGSSYGTLTNDAGAYFLSVPQGNTTIVFKYLGYSTQTKSIVISNNTTVDIELQEETTQMDEFVFHAGEDPAVPIIKKAIAKRNYYKNYIQPFEVDLYTKGVMKFINAPKTFLGRDLGNMDGILDSTRQGIFYLSESISKISSSPPHEYKEEMISSKVSGESRGVSANQFSYAKFNFYNESISLFRELISPIADDALSYYNFYLYDKFKDENGYTVSKIKVKPKSAFRPCFKGFIYINDSLANINSLDLKIYGSTVKNPVMDTIRIHQVFVPIKNDYWALITQNIDFDFSVFAFKARGNFHYIFNKYNANPNFPKSFFGKEIFAVRDSVIKNNDSYWNEARPVPLAQEEVRDYVRKDSIAKVIASPTYLDSVDRVNNKFKLSDILFGYNATKGIHNLSYGISSPLSTILFNAVEGTTASIWPYITKTNVDGYNINRGLGEIRYGFLDKKLKWSFENKWTYNVKSLSSIKLGAGHDYLQYNELGIVTPFTNSISSLLFKQNYVKLYDKRYVNLTWASEVINGLHLEVASQYAARNDLDNNTQFSYFRKNRTYLPNNPNNIPDEKFAFTDKIFEQSISLKWSPNQKYQTYPTYKIRVNSKYPTFYLKVNNASKINNNFVKFAKIKLTIIDNYIPLKVYGYSMYHLEFGKFLNSSKINVIDNFHFQGNHLVSGFRSGYLQTFKLQDGYEFSTDKPFATAWYEHHFDGYIMDKIPGLNKLGITTIVSCSTLHQKGYNYIEPGIGIEGIRLGAIDLARLDYYWAFEKGAYKESGFRIGFSMFIESIIKDK
jgi:hypothetical protein